MVEQIRNLLNVSLQFRQEFADVFWTKIHIDISQLASFGRSHIGVLADFLEGRPAVRVGIRHITFQFDFHCDVLLQHKRHQHKLAHFIQTISTLPNPETLSMDFTIHKDKLHVLKSDSEIHGRLKDFGSLPMRFGLGLNLRISSQGDVPLRDEGKL